MDHIRVFRKIGSAGLPGRYHPQDVEGNVAVFVTLIGALAGFVSMLIDNVVVVLMFTPVVFHACRRFKFPILCTCDVRGPLCEFHGNRHAPGRPASPDAPQCLRIEFAGFLWQAGRRPLSSSFLSPMFSLAAISIGCSPRNIRVFLWTCPP